MPASPPQEIATIVVNGRNLTNWESVMVSQRLAEGYHIFEFTTAESVPPAPSFVQNMPDIGDIVDITLGGQQAIHGVVTIRQSAADARRHEVQIIGKSLTWQLAKSSVVSPDGNYDGQNLAQIAQNVAGQVGVSVSTIGNLDLTPFEKMQSAFGQASWDFLEHLCRERGTILGSDQNGKLLLIGLHEDTISADAFVEGVNIERIQVIWSNETVYQNLGAYGQNAGSDAAWGSDVSELYGHAAGNDPNASNIVYPQEHPDVPAEVQQRAQFEARWSNGTQLTAHITVKGWLRDDGSLWGLGEAYSVTAPDHGLNGKMLKAKTITFQQDDDSGTTTTLELVLPWQINGLLMQTGLPAAPPPADTAPMPTAL